MLCRDWENAADLAWVDLDLASTQQELPHVMTTSHPDELEEEIVLDRALYGQNEI